MGTDVAGVVVALGAGATRFAVGDEVFGTADGSFAQLAIAKEEHLDRLRRLAESGALRAAVGSRYPLERVSDAVSDLAAGRIAGKAVVTVRGAR
ncbi:zinc-binding dehydrogenase [Demequina capsici]|uniref:Zinc-binding dehydrogenase n=1 Tax=Demequina capsici TaxID=3075620 RepID=A0AA96JAH2_9MICO|nr:zinc-binding dehydrogenase [Demequina sp. PMTSA13]WNM28377.1 zinc-binding dehydrogenase [Demequina sp. PMTSA13]